MATRFVGARVKRVEDPRLLTGRGCYVDDVTVPGMLHAAFAAQPARARTHRPRRCGACPSSSGRRRSVHRPRHREHDQRLRRAAAAPRPVPPDAPGARGGPRASGRRPGRARRRLHARDRGGRGRARRGRVRHASAGRHHRPGARPRSSSRMARRRRQRALPHRRRVRRRRVGVPCRGPRRAPAVRAASPLQPADGDAGVRRRGRLGVGLAHLLRGDAEPARPEVVARAAGGPATDYPLVAGAVASAGSPASARSGRRGVRDADARADGDRPDVHTASAPEAQTRGSARGPPTVPS